MLRLFRLWKLIYINIVNPILIFIRIGFFYAYYIFDFDGCLFIAFYNSIRLSDLNKFYLIYIVLFYNVFRYVYTNITHTFVRILQE